MSSVPVLTQVGSHARRPRCRLRPLKAQPGLPVISGLKEAFLIWGVRVLAGRGLHRALGPPSPLRLGLSQKPPSASDSDSKPESEGAKGEPAAVARSASCSSSSASSSSSSDSEVSVKKPPRGRKPGRIAVAGPEPVPGGPGVPAGWRREGHPVLPFRSREASSKTPWAETEAGAAAEHLQQ